MREDHLIDAPWAYAQRLRAGARDLLLAGWALAASVVLSTLELPNAHHAPLARTSSVVLLLTLIAGSLALWARAWWRLTDVRTEAIASRAVTLASHAVRVLLVLATGACAAWSVLATLRAVGVRTDDNLALLLVRTTPPVVPIVALSLLLAIASLSQALVRALRERTAPARPGVFAFPLTLATLPVGLVTLPSAMNRPSALAFSTMVLALLFAFQGAQGAILRARIARVLRERRRAEVLASREPPR
ncbi:MAG: hypothetical protein AAGH64_06795, partial [Planctomycetota bacterium]